MRSEQVFRAHETVKNRYLLCRATARVTRRLHFASGSTHDAIEDAFARVARQPNLLNPLTLATAPRELDEGWPAGQLA